MHREMLKLATAITAAITFATGVGTAETQANPEALATPRVSTIAVDGMLSDWKSVAALTSESEPKLTAVAQDEEFLYAYFRSGDLDLARRVLRSGAIVWVNVKGVHDEGYGLRFRGTESVQKAVDAAVKAKTPPAAEGATAGQPAGSQAAAAQSASGQSSDRQRGTSRRRSSQGATQRAPLGTVEVLNDGAVNELINTGARDGGPAAACRFADDEVVYEFRIPLAEIGVLAGSERAVAVGFQMGGRTQADRRAAEQQQTRRRRTQTPPPWGAPAASGGGEAQADTEGATDGAPAGTAGSAGTSSTARSSGGTDSTAGAQTDDTRRRSFPTAWHDLTIATAAAAPAK
jgi:hypothetical protein